MTAKKFAAGETMTIPQRFVWIVMTSDQEFICAAATMEIANDCAKRYTQKMAERGEHDEAIVMYEPVFSAPITELEARKK